MQTGYDHTVDWWAVGVLLFHFLTGVTPFMAESQVQYVRSTVQTCSILESHIDLPFPYFLSSFVMPISACPADPYSQPNPNANPYAYAIVQERSMELIVTGKIHWDALPEGVTESAKR